MRCGWESKTAHSCSIGPVEPHACHEGGVDGCWGLCARERERRKTKMRLMIYTPATVYYRLELVRGYHPFVFFFIFFSRRLRAFFVIRFLRLVSLTNTLRSLVFFIYILYFIQTIWHQYFWIRKEYWICMASSCKNCSLFFHKVKHSSCCKEIDFFFWNMRSYKIEEAVFCVEFYSRYYEVGPRV